MLWRGGRRSGNIEDRRGGGTRLGFPGGMPRGGISIAGILALALISIFFGVDPGSILQPGAPPDEPGAETSGPAGDELKDFVAVVLADTEDTWHEIFRRMGKTYVEPRLVLFAGAVESACGFAQAAIGPFYCPRDRKVYIDLSFYRDLRDRFQAPGDFAEAYVIAHEIGHHVQTLLGITRQVDALRSRAGQTEANALSVRVELQADCLAGIWAHHADRTRHVLEAGDVEEALAAASAIGDDRLQREPNGYVDPDSFTHGISAQRVRWFKRGLAQGDLADCDTFGAGWLRAAGPG